MEGLLGIIWCIALVAIFSRVVKKNGGTIKFINQTKTAATQADADPFEKGDSGVAVEIPLESGPDKAARAGVHHVRPGKLKAGEARPARSFLKDTSAISETLAEDRQHDWLARQIREEKKHTVWNNFVDLGAAHDEVCAAELARLEHKRQHQSYVVDDGVSDN